MTSTPRRGRHAESGDVGLGGVRRRVTTTPKQVESLLVLGATGNAGTMAVRVAKLLGAATWSAPDATPSGCTRCPVGADEMSS